MVLQRLVGTAGNPQEGTLGALAERSLEAGPAEGRSLPLGQGPGAGSIDILLAEEARHWWVPRTGLRVWPWDAPAEARARDTMVSS